MSKSYDVTSAGVNPTEDRAHRMRMYYIAMSLRVLGVISLFWVRGWWVLLVGIAVAVLPWFAVMVGNAVQHGSGERPDAPEPQQLEGSPTADDAAPRDDAVIVVDVEPMRRGAATGTGASGDQGVEELPDTGADSDLDPGVEGQS